MKLRIEFSFSEDERWLRLSLWGFDIWRSDDSGYDFEDFDIAENSGKAGFLSFEKTAEEDGEDGDFGKLLFRALFYPDVASGIWRALKKLLAWAYNLFSMKFENIEIKGSLGDPFCDAIAYGMLGGCYEPNWRDESGSWSAKGEAVLKASFFHFLFIMLAAAYEAAVLAFVLWRGTRLAKEEAA